jgi:hypothetical protein
MVIVPYYQRDAEGGVPYVTHLRHVTKNNTYNCDREQSVAGSNPQSPVSVCLELEPNNQNPWIAEPALSEANVSP